ncbi:hypothetical protein UFOVP823_1, partial [uncultured Caudovirales phage]
TPSDSTARSYAVASGLDIGESPFEFRHVDTEAVELRYHRQREGISGAENPAGRAYCAFTGLFHVVFRSGWGWSVPAADDQQQE